MTTLCIHTYIHTGTTNLFLQRERDSIKRRNDDLEKELVFLSNEVSRLNVELQEQNKVCMYVCVYVCMYIHTHDYDVQLQEQNKVLYVCIRICVSVYVTCICEKELVFLSNEVSRFNVELQEQNKVCMYVYIYVCMYVKS
jgi:hypothetical protein